MKNIPTIGVNELVESEAFRLKISQYLEIIHPSQYYIFVEDFNPADYYTTSGDASLKTKQLLKDLLSYQAMIRSIINVLGTYSDGELDLLAQLEKNVESAKVLQEDLKKAKGENCFLETEWDDLSLKIIPKNPRR